MVARARLAELEAGFTIEKAKVEAMQARLFARRREHFQRRDRDETARRTHGQDALTRPPPSRESPAMKALAALLALTLFPLAPLRAEDAPPAPAEIHALRDRLLDALNKSDFDQMAACLHPRAVITYQNAEVARGRDGVKAFQLKMTAGPEKFVESFHADVKTDDITLLPGGTTAIVTGSSAETYKMAHGADLTLDGRWTATLVQDNGQWLVAALHCSTGLFKSPVIAATKKAGVTASTASIIIGLIAGWLLGRKRVF